MPNWKIYYDELCSSRKKINRTKTKNDYYELHHIIPKCLGGTNSADNLVLLTAREHYIAHLLLYAYYKSIGGVEFRKISFALVAMSGFNKKQTRYKLSNRQYEIIKEAARNSRLNHKVLDTINYKKPKTNAHKESIRNARLNSVPRNLATIEKMSNSAKRRGDNFIGNYTLVTCTVCSKTGQTNAMTRWHFDNCKFLKKKEVANA